MEIIIIGAGRIGRHLARILMEEEHDVTIVERNGDLCHEIASDIGCTTIRGDATKPEILEDAGVREADAIVVLTGSDETNLMVSMMAKKMGAKNVAARLGSLHYDEGTLKMIGLDVVIYPEAAAAGYISELVTKPEVLDLAFIGRGEAEIVEMNLTKKSKVVGKKIKEIEHPKGTAIIAIYDKGKLKIPDPETRLNQGDKVLVLAKVEKVKHIKKLLGAKS